MELRTGDRGGKSGAVALTRRGTPMKRAGASQANSAVRSLPEPSERLCIAQRTHGLPDTRYRPIGGRDPRPMRGHALAADTPLHTKEVYRMRAKLSGWKHLLFTAATLATLALAAGARYKPN